MNVVEKIYERHAITYVDEQHTLSESEEQDLLETIIENDGGFDSEHWHFVILNKSELNGRIQNNFGDDQLYMLNTSFFILLTMELKAWQKEPKRYWMNAHKIMQSLMFTAEDFGYRSCSVAEFDIEGVAERMNLSEDYVIGPMAAIGKSRNMTIKHSTSQEFRR